MKSLLTGFALEPNALSVTWMLPPLPRSSPRSRKQEGAFHFVCLLRFLTLTFSQSVSVATCIKCNVTDFDQQVEMFELAIRKYGAVDIVVPNAGINERGFFDTPQFKDGKPIKPDMLTLEVNLLGVLYSTLLIEFKIFN